MSFWAAFGWAMVALIVAFVLSIAIYLIEHRGDW